MQTQGIVDELAHLHQLHRRGHARVLLLHADDGFDVIQRVGEGALLRFYVLHCVGLPLVAGFLMAIHFWRIRRDGGISGPL